MKRTITKALLIVANSWTVGLSKIHAQVSYQQSKLSPEVLLFTPNERGVGNSIAILGESGVLVVDASYSPSGAREIIRMISAETGLPIQYLLNTHWHDDHIWGNQSFREAFPDITILSHVETRRSIVEKAIPSLSATIVGLESSVKERDRMIASGEEGGQLLTEERRQFLAKRQQLFKSTLADFKKIEPTLPNLVFRDSLTLFLGKMEVRLLHLGQGHTVGDVVVHIPGAKVMILGDLITRPIPAGSVVPLEKQIATLKKVASIEADIWVSGHGEVMTDQTTLNEQIDLLESLQKVVQKAQEEKLSLDQCMAIVRDRALGSNFTKGDPRLIAAFERFFIRVTLEPLFTTKN